MKLANNIKLSVFAKEDEDAEAVRDALLGLVPFSLEEQKIPFGQKNAVGFHEKIIKVMNIELSKERHTTPSLKHILGMLTAEQRAMLKEKLPGMIDESCNLFIRLDKGKLLQGVPWLTQSGDCFHIRISVAAFPKRKDRAVKLIEGLLTSI